MRSNLPFVFIALAIFLIGGLGENLLLALLASVTFLIGSSLLWRPRETPILLFIFCYQWVQFSILIFYGNWSGHGVDSLTTQGGNIELSIVLSQIALIFFVIGLRLGAGARRPQDGELATAIAKSHSISFFFRCYLLAFTAAFAAESVAYIVPGLTQLFLAAAHLKWAFFFMLAYASFIQKDQSKVRFLMVFALELAWGIGGFFSDFKSVFIVTLAAAAASNIRISAPAAAGLGVLVCVLLTFGVVWTAIKPAYRGYVNGGEQAQIVTVDYVDRISKLFELVATLNEDTLGEGAEMLVRRISYVEIFGAVTDYVPRIAPHENGELWLDAVIRPMTPRLFFPEKSVIDDSLRTIKYTGLTFATGDKGASISIGYVGEAYIDFGEYGMMAPVFLFGLLTGYIYRATLRSPYSPGVFGMGLATALLLEELPAESSITKSIGGLIVTVLVGWLLRRYLAPRLFPQLLTR